MKNWFSLFFLLFSVNIFSQEFFLPESSYINYPMMTFSFKGNKIEYWEAGTINKDGSIKEPEKNLQGTYFFEIVDKVNFINVQWENNQNEKYLILFNNELCFLYKMDGNMYFRGFKMRRGAPGESCFSVAYSNVEITASSYLLEGNVVYSTDKLNEKAGECWAEGVSGQGLNEILYMKMAGTNSIHISTGFVSFSKPYLFDQNSRPKKIELSVDNKYRIIVDLDDTPNFQTINLPEQLGRNEVLRLRILEVYNGTKYEDTCINTILFDWGKY
jgi:hypothetical protein